jgi:putative membrane protein insertion efficiency factor
MSRRAALRDAGKPAVHGLQTARTAARTLIDQSPANSFALPYSPITRVNRVILFLLALYRRTLSPLLGQRCRFEPSCSEYASVAIARFGSARGGILAAVRLARCQPLCRGGFDPVPQVFTLRRAVNDNDEPHTHRPGEKPHE